VREGAIVGSPVLGPETVALLLGEAASVALTESMHVLAVNNRGRIIVASEVARGGRDGAGVTIADVFRVPVAVGALGIVLAHNHPSGDPTPSVPDVEMTREVEAAGRLLGVKLLDHVIVCSRGSFYSFHSAGRIA
jgi:DNA repair protein RadC